MVCRERSDYYEPLPDSDLENGEEKELAREQAAQEDKYERMLMDVYNALYKVHRLAFPIIKFVQGAEAVLVPRTSRTLAQHVPFRSVSILECAEEFLQSRQRLCLRTKSSRTPAKGHIPSAGGKHL